MRLDSISDGADYEGHWPSGFYIWGFNYNGTCVADGRYKSNVGKDASEIFGSYEAHESLKIAASNNFGAAWVEYMDIDGVPHIAQVTKVAKSGQFYYIAVSFAKEMPPFDITCSSAYASPCSERNGEALLGLVASEILPLEGLSDVAATVGTITSRRGKFSEEFMGDFSAHVFTIESAELGCPTNATCPDDWPSTWYDQLFSEGTTQDSTWMTLPASGSVEAAEAYVMRIVWAATSTVDSQEFLLVTLIGTSTAPTRCTSGTDCPSDATCGSDGYCVCNNNFLANFTMDESACGHFLPSVMSCVDVKYQSCDGDLNCKPCPAGKYCSDGDEFTCQIGFYCPEGVAYEPCPVGTMGSVAGGMDKESTCQECPAGTYSENPGSSECQQCAAGTVNSGTGQASCEQCAVGTYQDSAGGLSCTACPSSMTTMVRAANSAMECVCPGGTYQPLGEESCVSCPEGMSCNNENNTEAAAWAQSSSPFPLAMAGFASLPLHPLEAYRCKESSWCPGGAAGVCATNRDATAVACSRCLPDTYTSTDGSCHNCSENTAVVVMVTGVVICTICLIVFAHLVNRNQLNQSNAMTVIVISVGLSVSAIQTLGIFSNLTVRWVEPVNSMFQALSVVSFDLKILRTECVMGSDGVRNLVLRQSIAPVAALLIAFIVAINKKFRDPRIEFSIQTVNAVGAIFQLFFVSIFVSMLTPFICYKHPGDLGYSMVSDPAVLCTQSGEHAWLVVVSALALTIIVLPYLAITTYATVAYQGAMGSSKSSYRHLRRYRFLFFRYSPETYWYGTATLFRGTLVCLVPVVARDAPSMQVIGMASILLSFCSLQLSTKPWRGFVANVMDAAVCLLMVLLVLCVAMTTDFEDSEYMLGTVAAVVFSGVFVGILGAIVFSFVKHLVPAPFYHRFICHHKADAAAQARFLQLLLVQRSGQTCFIDSDHLSHLEDLFDIVRTRCGRLIVYLTTDTLRRPWCAGEITIAYQLHRRITTITHPTFVAPSVDHLKAENIEGYLATADFKLVEYGITDEFIAAAYRWMLLELKDNFDLALELVGRDRFEQVVDRMLKKTSSTRKVEPVLRPSVLAISSQRGDDEATACAGILIGMIQASIIELVPAGMLVLTDMEDPTSPEVLTAISMAHALVVLLSAGSLDCEHQLQLIVTAIGSDVPCIPVNTPTFRFPSNQFFEEDLPDRYEGKAKEVEHLLSQFFKTISIGFTSYASMQVLEAQAAGLVERIPRHPRPLGAKRCEIQLMLSDISTRASSVKRHGSEKSAASRMRVCTELTC